MRVVREDPSCSTPPPTPVGPCTERHLSPLKMVPLHSAGQAGYWPMAGHGCSNCDILVFTKEHEWMQKLVLDTCYMQGFLQARFWGGGDSAPKISYSPPKFLLTLFLITLSPPTPRLLPPPQSPSTPPPPRWNPAGNPDVMQVMKHH